MEREEAEVEGAYLYLQNCIIKNNNFKKFKISKESILNISSNRHRVICSSQLALVLCNPEVSVTPETFTQYNLGTDLRITIHSVSQIHREYPIVIYKETSFPIAKSFRKKIQYVPGSHLKNNFDRGRCIPNFIFVFAVIISSLISITLAFIKVLCPLANHGNIRTFGGPILVFLVQ